MCPNDKIKVLDCKASDNVYLHKEFHAALCYGIKYLEDRFGPTAIRQYFQRVGETYFAPLSEKLKKDGLAALEKHFSAIMDLESGEYAFHYKDDTLVLEVTRCPAIAYLKSNDSLLTDRFCESTVIVNETICRNAGYQCSCTYEKGAGRCVQKFWKDEVSQ